MTVKKPAKGKKSIDERLDEIQGSIHRIEKVLQELQVSIDEDLEGRLKVLTNMNRKAIGLEPEFRGIGEDDFEEEGEGDWVIQATPENDEDDVLYFRGQLDTEDEEDSEVWDKNIRKAVVYGLMKSALIVAKSLGGPGGSDSPDYVVTVEPFRKKVGCRKKVTDEDDEKDIDERYDPNYTYLISTSPNKPTKKKPRLFYQELGRYDGRWVMDIRRATHYACKKDAQKVFDRLDDVETDDFPEGYPPACVVKKNHEKDGLAEV